MKRNISSKEIVLGVTGSIAAYKACELASRLVELGASITPVLTKSAAELVGSATFEAITGRRAITALFEPLQNPEVEHIAVALRADLYLIAPATANFIAKAAHGIADDWLTTTLLATKAPLLIAPAMNANMYQHPATQQNIATLKERGAVFVGPDSGRLACRTVGPGRLIDPMTIMEACVPLLREQKDLAGKRVAISSGATHEPIDPVRFIGNRSSGKMGRAIAIEALARGAEVTTVCGPSEVAMPHNARVVPVQTAAEMAEAVAKLVPNCDVFIAAAAVGDYRVESPGKSKLKKTGTGLQLDLVENPDVLEFAGSTRKPGQLIVGFAAETDDLVANAKAKLDKKNLDLVVVNHVNSPDSGFGKDTTTAAFIARDGTVEELPNLPKDELAEKLIDRVADLLAGK